jgi:hypothetical protein
MSLLKKIINTICIALLFNFHILAHAAEYKDNEIKAAFLYRLLYFIEWPKADDKSQFINICILGKNPFKDIQGDLEKKSVNKKQLRLISIDNQTVLSSNCKILFISDSEKSDYKDVLNLIKSHPILSVSDMVKFSKNKGMIGLEKFNDSIKLEINLEELSEAKFKIDPNLLEAAAHVY